MPDTTDRTDQDDSGTRELDERVDAGEPARGHEASGDARPAGPDDTHPPEGRVPGLLEEPDFQRFGRVVKLFLWPFFFSWALAYVGGARNMDWLHFTGLGGVVLCMVALLVWLISSAG